MLRARRYETLANVASSLGTSLAKFDLAPVAVLIENTRSDRADCFLV